MLGGRGGGEDGDSLNSIDICLLTGLDLPSLGILSESFLSFVILLWLF